MSRQLLFVLGIIMTLSFRAKAGDIPFTSAGIASLKGKDLCDLQGEFNKRLGVYLDSQNRHSVSYRERDGVVAVFLLSKPLSPVSGRADRSLDGPFLSTTYVQDQNRVFGHRYLPLN